MIPIFGWQKGSGECVQPSGPKIDVVYIFGGSTGASPSVTNIVERWNGTSIDEMCQTLDTSLSSHSAAEFPTTNTSYIFGGTALGVIMDQIQKHTGTAMTTESATLQDNIQNHTSANLTSFTADYIFGGFTTGVIIQNEIEKWDGTNATVETATLVDPLYYSAAAELKNDPGSPNNKIYNFGGVFGGTSADRSDDIYSWDGITSARINNLLSSELIRACAAELSNLTADYIFGGNEGTNGVLNNPKNTIRKWNGTTVTTEVSTLSTTKILASASEYPSFSAIYHFAGNILNPEINPTKVDVIEKWDGTTRSTESATLTIPRSTTAASHQ